MSNEGSRSRRRGAGRTALRAGVRLFADLLIVGLWVVFVTLFFLTAGWPQWLYYAVLILGVGGYVQLTASWW